MTAKDIDGFLKKCYENSVKYFVSNIYFFDNGYCETDVLLVRNNGYLNDIEIKVSKSDFLADFKKLQKHRILETGYHRHPYDKPIKADNWYKADTDIPAERPNRFYYCCPENLIQKHEVPKYSGLLWMSESGQLTKIKEAPLLHKDKIEVESKLCRKFYYAYQELKQYKEENGIANLKKIIARYERNFKTI